MTAETRTIGFCTACMKNIAHVREIHHPVLRLLDRLTFHAVGGFRLGFWHCIQCGKTSYRLPFFNPDAPTFEGDDESGEKNVHESVGNFIKTEQSLLLRSHRAHRFSEKYRDGIVMRLLSGNATMAQVGRELEVSDVDLMDWIADLFQRKQERLNELEEMLQRVPKQEHLLEFDTPRSFASKDALDADPK